MGRTVALVITGMVLPMISCMEKPGTPNSPSGASNQETVKLNDEAPTIGSARQQFERISGQSVRVEREFRGREQTMSIAQGGFCGDA